MRNRFWHVPELHLLIALPTAMLAGWSLSKNTFAAFVFGAMTLVTGLVSWYSAHVRRRSVKRLQTAGHLIGSREFSRPYLGDVAPELDAVASALARRHESLLKTNEELQRTGAAIDALFAAFPGPCLLISPTGAVDRINQAVCTTFHITPEDAVGRPFLHVIRSPKIDDALRRCLSSGRGVVIEVDLRIAQPPPQFVVHIEPITDIRIQGAVLFLHDVTRLKHLEQVRKEFVANVSHELRTPITSIKGFIETLLEKNVPPERRTRFLTILKQETDRLYNLVQELLSLSLLESEIGTLHREPVDIRRLAHEVLALLQPQASEKNIETQFLSSEDLPVIFANPTMLEQAFVALVDNAMKYSPMGSTVTIEARRIAGEHVEIAVADNGPGIPSDHIPRLFERFYRVDTARSKSVGGTGLGLAIVRHIVQRHGGSVRAESRLGKGSRFVMTLPLRTEDSPGINWDH